MMMYFDIAAPICTEASTRTHAKFERRRHAPSSSRTAPCSTRTLAVTRRSSYSRLRRLAGRRRLACTKSVGILDSSRLREAYVRFE